MARLFTSFLSSSVLLLSNSQFATAAKEDIYGPSTAFTSRYWDCCKPSCSWADKARFVENNPVTACDANNTAISDDQAGSACGTGGNAFACTNQAPWAVNDTFSYGFVGAHLLGGDEGDWCCSCYELEFLDEPLEGKRMVVQASNTDYEMPDQNIFTFGIPGGNTSHFNACAAQYNVPPSDFGQKEVGVATRDECDNLPQVQREACHWRFDWFLDASAPKVNYRRVTCPTVLTDITQCSRTDEPTFEASANRTSAASALINKPSTAFSALVTTSGVLFLSWLLFV